MPKDRRVDAVLLATLVGRIDVCKAEDLILLITDGVNMIAKSDFILGQRPSLLKSAVSAIRSERGTYLITAQYAHSTQILDRAQSLHDSLLLG